MLGLKWFKARFQKPLNDVIGLDIGAGSIKLLELSQRDGHYRVDSHAVVNLQPGVILEKEIKNTMLVAEAIKKAIHEAQPKSRDVVIAIPDSSVITKVIQLDAELSDRDIEEQILVEADRYIPYPIEEVSLDFQVLGRSIKNPECIDVLLVASHKEYVDTYVGMVVASGLKVQVVDVQSYAIGRVFPLLAEQIPGLGIQQTTAIVDIGAAMLMLVVLHDSNIIFTRCEAFGGQQLTQSIQQRYKLPFDEAELAKQQSNLPSDYEIEILGQFKASVVLQIRRALQFFLSNSQYTEVQQIILAGGTALLPGLVEQLAEQLGVSVFLANPFGHMEISPKIDVSTLNKIAPSLLLSCGLALRQVQTRTGVLSGW